MFHRFLIFLFFLLWILLHLPFTEFFLSLTHLLICSFTELLISSPFVSIPVVKFSTLLSILQNNGCFWILCLRTVTCQHLYMDIVTILWGSCWNPLEKSCMLLRVVHWAYNRLCFSWRWRHFVDGFLSFGGSGSFHSTPSPKVIPARN